MNARSWILIALVALALALVMASTDPRGGREGLGPARPGEEVAGGRGAPELLDAPGPAREESARAPGGVDPDSGSRASPDSGGPKLVLRVLDGVSGAPLRGAQLLMVRSLPWADSQAEVVVRTDEAGRLELRRDSPEVYYAFPDVQLQEGEVASWREFDPPYLRASSSGELLLRALPPALVVHASVVGFDGEPFHGMQLRRRSLWRPGPYTEAWDWELLEHQQPAPDGTLALALFETDLQQPFWLAPRKVGAELEWALEPLLIERQRGDLSHVFEPADIVHLGVEVREHDGSPAMDVLPYVQRTERPEVMVRGSKNSNWGGVPIDWGFFGLSRGSWTLVVLDARSREELARKELLVQAEPNSTAERERLERDKRVPEQDEELRLPLRDREEPAVSGVLRDRWGEPIVGVIVTCEFATGERISARSRQEGGTFALYARRCDQPVRVFPGGGPWEGVWEPMVREVAWGSRDLTFTRAPSKPARVVFAFRREGSDAVRTGLRHVVVYREAQDGRRPLMHDLIAYESRNPELSCPITLAADLHYVARVPGFRCVRGEVPASGQRGVSVEVNVDLVPGLAESYHCLDEGTGVPLAGVRVLGEGGQLLGSSGGYGRVDIEAEHWPYELVFELDGYRPYRLRLDWDGLSEHWDGRVRLTRAP